MIKFIKDFFCKNQISELEKENQELKDKLVEKQEVINNTNKYWKKKLYNLEAKHKKKKGPNYDL